MLTRFQLIGLLQSSISNLGGEAVTIPTNVDSEIPVNGAAVELSLAQPPPYCMGNLSKPAVIPDVDLASILLLHSLLCLLLYMMLKFYQMTFMHFISNNLSSSSLPTMTTQFHESFFQEWLLALGSPVLGEEDNY